MIDLPTHDTHPRNSTSDFPSANPLKCTLINSVFRITHSRTAAKLWDLITYPNPDGRADWMDITHLTLELPGLPAEFNGYRIVHISDLHVGTWLKPYRLEQVVDQINSQAPHLVAITGDFVTHHPEEFGPMIVKALGRLTPRDGILAVLGNHDHWSDPAVVREIIAGSGAVDLSNRIYTLERNGQRLHFAGVDCTYLGLDRLDIVLEQLPPGDAAVLLAHEPDYADRSSAAGRFMLQLSGHSHGGQVCLPGIGPIFLPRHGRQYPSGLYHINGMQLYSNRGLGTAELQVRIGCPPEIAVITLSTPDYSQENGVDFTVKG